MTFEKFRDSTQVLSWVSTCPFFNRNRNGNGKSNKKISFHYFNLNEKENPFYKQAITFFIKIFFMVTKI